MVLASQQARSGTQRSYMYARRRPRRVQPWWFVAGGAVLVIGWYAWPDASSGGPNDTGAAGLVAENDDDESSAPTPGARETATTSLLPNGTATPIRRDRETPAERGEERVESTPTNAITMGESSTKSVDEVNPPKAVEPALKDPTPVTTAPLDPAPNRATITNANAQVADLIVRAEKLERQNRLVEARQAYNDALHHARVGDAAPAIRAALSRINQTLVFSPTVVSGDPFADSYTIKSGDRLSKVAAPYDIDWRFLTRINGIEDARKIRAGQTIKVVRGPFHAVIDKSEYRMDLFIGAPDSLGRRVFVRSFPVGLGEFDSTPTGAWMVREQSKLINPPWANPRTGEQFAADDPKNPIGERWIGLKGVDEDTRNLSGYGIHGTIEPDSIGRQASMGCVRMRADDVAIIYEMLVEGESTVFIHD
ncbi:MAG: L,D-transpeptidase family protein [Phycisphaerales bacterium]